MLLELAREKKILFFGGKGGVGKTTVSAATALAMANEGRTVLLVSTDPAHNLGHLFACPIGPKPKKLTAGLDVMELDPAETVKMHMEEITNSLHRLMPVNLRSEVDKHMTLSRDAPGMQEAAILERIAEVVEQGVKEYDLIIFDTAPSGHTARLMVLPEMMSAWTEGLIKRREKADRFAEIVRGMGSDSSMEDKIFGADAKDSDLTRESGIRRILNRRRMRFTGLRDRLADPEQTSFIIVLAAERLPVLETIELHEQLLKANVSIGGVVVNKRSPAGMGAFLEERRVQEELHLTTLAKALPNLARQDLYLTAQDIIGIKALEQLAEKF